MKDPMDAKIHKCTLKMLRAWPGVFDSHVLLDNFCALIRNAKDYIYIEHQYPFHNFALTHCLCEALQRNKNLRVIIVTPVKTDLPTGIVGKLLDMSQDDSMKWLFNI
jgi:phosphatidylserine/phosphatidylglycerophosphate/cardiolipin synthase-like enzyme